MAASVKFFAGSATHDLAEKIAIASGRSLGKASLARFADGEFQPSFEETVRGSDVFLIQSTFAPSDNLMELLLMADAAKRASANEIIAVIPYFGFSRQDRKDKPRVGIGASLVAKLIEASNFTRVMTMDLHADQIQGFFSMPVDHLYASSIFVPYLKSLALENPVMAAPDTGGTKRANAYAKHLDAGLAIGYKQRKRANEIANMTIIGDVKGKNVVLVDDIVDTAGTLATAADMIIKKGAASVRAICTHPVLSGPAYDRIEASKLTELIVTDTIPLKQESNKIRVLTTANLFAEVIRGVVSHESISPHFVF